MTEPAELRVPAEASGARLDRWLSTRLDLARSAVARAIDQGLVTVDGKPRPKSFQLSGNETVVVRASAPASPPASSPGVETVFEDADLIVLEKPAGLVVHPAAGHRGKTLTEQLAERSGGVWEPLLVHRLDRDTSGLMVVAKTVAVQSALRAQLANRELIREYLALVHGVPAVRTGTIDAPIGRDRQRRTRMSVETGKPREAVTHFEVERRLGELALLRVRLETGRTHQIRAHLSAIGHPVYGDHEYGARGAAEAVRLGRQFLHSTRLVLRHPVSGARVEWQSGLPADLQETLRRLSG